MFVVTSTIPSCQKAIQNLERTYFFAHPLSCLCKGILHATSSNIYIQHFISKPSLVWGYLAIVFQFKIICIPCIKIFLRISISRPFNYIELASELPTRLLNYEFVFILMQLFICLHAIKISNHLDPSIGQQ